MSRIIICLHLILFPLSICLSQGLPNTNIYMLDMEQDDTLLRFSAPKLLTGFNLKGYNNQPSFINNSELLITVALPNENQTDIYLLDLDKKNYLRMTETPESEYSPKVTPENLYFSVVRVETDSEKSQILWQYPLDRRDKGRTVFRYLRGVGYYHWLDRFQLAIFNVSETNHLTIGDIRDGSFKNLAPNIGRCFQNSPNGRLVFIHKITPGNWVIKAMDKNTLQVEEIITAVPGCEDFVILKDGSLLMGKGSRLFQFHPRKDTQWTEVAELKNLGITNITRMAVSSDGKLVLVNG
jgi:Tol biopolymer transport system component